MLLFRQGIFVERWQHNVKGSRCGQNTFHQVFCIHAKYHNLQCLKNQDGNKSTNLLTTNSSTRRKIEAQGWKDGRLQRVNKRTNKGDQNKHNGNKREK
jgi:hypothetical protein